MNLYSPTYKFRQAVWTTGSLTPGTHTIRIEWTGAKDAASSNTFVGVDRLDVIGWLKQAEAFVPPATRHEETDTKVVYDGNWIGGTSPALSAGQYCYLQAAGGVTAKFNGTKLTWITTKAPNYGVARVNVDGGAWVDVDLYSAAFSYRAEVWNTGTLPAGTHTVRIEWTGRKNGSSSANYIGVDAFDVLLPGTLVQAP